MDRTRQLVSIERPIIGNQCEWYHEGQAILLQWHFQEERDGRDGPDAGDSPSQAPFRTVSNVLQYSRLFDREYTEVLRDDIKIRRVRLNIGT